MRAPASLCIVAAVLALADLGARASGWAEHTSVLAGMPRSEASWVLGPLYVVLHLTAVVIVPVLGLAGAIALLFRARLSPP